MGRGTASVVFRNFRRAIPQEEKGFDPMCDVGVVATMAFIRIERTHNHARAGMARARAFRRRM